MPTFEKLPFQFDINQLIQQYKHIEQQFPMVIRPDLKGNGGWSILSSNGSYKDGWYMGASCFESNDKTSGLKKIQLNSKKINSLQGKPSKKYSVPTEICTGYIEEVMALLKKNGLDPTRARIAKIAAGYSTLWHRDGRPTDYAVRLHIPILTHTDVIFHTESGSRHLPADGSAYLIHVNQMHNLENNSPIDRIHLIMDIRDYKGISQFHKYNLKNKLHDFFKRICLPIRHRFKSP